VLRVYYVASAMTPTPPNDPFNIPLEGFERDMTITSTSVFVAAQQAVLGFAALPAESAKTFLFTGNILNVTTLPGFITQGAAKSAAAHMMMAAAAAYADRGFK
jgi:NAD(P)-dependent dehydrogenase (short-subunit alcohol dehydrogenase family)